MAWCFAAAWPSQKDAPGRTPGPPVDRSYAWPRINPGRAPRPPTVAPEASDGEPGRRPGDGREGMISPRLRGREDDRGGDDLADPGGEGLGHHAALGVAVAQQVADLVDEDREQVHAAGDDVAAPTRRAAASHPQPAALSSRVMVEPDASPSRSPPRSAMERSMWPRLAVSAPRARQ